MKYNTLIIIIALALTGCASGGSNVSESSVPSPRQIIRDTTGTTTAVIQNGRILSTNGSTIAYIRGDSVYSTSGNRIANFRAK
jgi:ABC-type Fe3+-hydroxamate transport system substrate-binding protein